MTATQLKAIIAHGETLQAIFPKTRQMDPVRLCKQLRRLEARAHAIGLRLCNGPEFPGGYDEVDELTDAILAKVDNLTGYKAAGVPVFINRDPRGAALKIESEWLVKQREDYDRTIANHGKRFCTPLYWAILGLHRDMGGYGILAPEIDRNGR